VSVPPRGEGGVSFHIGHANIKIVRGPSLCFPILGVSLYMFTVLWLKIVFSSLSALFSSAYHWEMSSRPLVICSWSIRFWASVVWNISSYCTGCGVFWAFRGVDTCVWGSAVIAPPLSMAVYMYVTHFILSYDVLHTTRMIWCMISSYYSHSCFTFFFGRIPPISGPFSRRDAQVLFLMFVCFICS